MVEGIRNAPRVRMQAVETAQPAVEAHETPTIPTVEHPRRRARKIASHLVAMTLAGASLLFTSGAVLGANHAPVQGKPLVETHVRTTVDSTRWANTRPLMKELIDARSSLADIESEARSIQTEIHWYQELLAKIGRGEAPPERRAEAEGVIARDRERLLGMSGELAQAKARVAEALNALQPSIDEAVRSLKARGLPTAQRYSSATWPIDAAAIAEAWVNRNGSLPASTDRLHWLLWFTNTEAILHALANHPQPLFSDPMELEAVGPVDPVGWQRAETLRDRFDYRPDARDLTSLASLDDNQFERLVSLFAELRDQAGFALTEKARPDKFGERWSITDVTTLIEIVRHGSFWFDPPQHFHAQRAELELADFVAAAAYLHGRGLSFEAEHTALAALLASNHAGARGARALLDHVAFTGRPGETEQLARAARFGGPEGRALDDGSLALVKEASSRMGRKLSVGEMSMLLSTRLPLDTVLPREAVARALAIDPHASLQDVALFASGATPIDGEPQLSTGAARNDQAAEYEESWDAAKGSLTPGDRIRIHRLLELFRSDENRAAIADAVAKDLADERAEVGGFISLDGKLIVVPSDPANDNSYVYPDDEGTLLGVLVPFHLHATHAGGNAFSAGPSSSFDGRNADRGTSRNRGLAEIVVTNLDRERFNVDYYTPSGAVVDLGTFNYSR